MKLLKDWLDRRVALVQFKRDGGREDAVSGQFLAERFSAARHCLRMGRRDEARRIWDEMYAKYPSGSMNSPIGFWLFVEIGAESEVDAIVDRGVRLHPGEAIFAEARAEILRRRGELDGAIRQCVAIRKSFPRSEGGYRTANIALSQLNRYDEAEALLAKAVTTLPEAADLFEAYAGHAERRGDWEEALRRWQTASYHFDAPTMTLGASRCLRAMGRFDDAHALIDHACKKLPANKDIQAELKRTVSRELHPSEQL